MSERIFFVPQGGMTGGGTAGNGGYNGGVFGGNGVGDFILGSMMGCGGMGGFGGWGGMGGAMWLWPWLFLACGRNGGFFGNDGNNQLNQIEETLATMQGNQALQAAIQGGVNETRALANQLGCDFNAVQAAISAVKDVITSVGNQNGMNFMQVLTAVGNNRSDIISQMQSCCCDLKTGQMQQTNELGRAIERVNDTVIKAACDSNYAMRDQTCAIEKSIEVNTGKILEGQRAAEFREIQDKLNAEREKNQALMTQLSQEHQTQQFAQISAQNTQPLAAAIGQLQQQMSGILCRLPETKTVPCDQGLYLSDCVMSQLRLAELARAAGYTLTPAATAAAAA